MDSTSSIKDTELPLTINMMTTNTSPPPDNTKKKKIEDELVIAESTEVATCQTSVPPRVPYNNGYGDFCFGRWASRPKKSAWDGTSYSQQFWEDGSNGIEVPELGDFRRSGPFPFFKQPLNVRQSIYHLLLAPLYQYREDEKSSCIYLEPKWADTPTYDPFSDRYDLDYEGFLEEQKLIRAIQPDDDGYDRFHSGRVVAVEPDMTVEEYEQGKAAHIHQYATHPSRKARYNLMLYPNRENPRRFDTATDYIYLEWLRNLSNVNARVRKELQEIFWTRVGIDAAFSSGYCATSCILALLEDRPAIIGGIKHISVGLNLTYLDLDRGSKNIRTERSLQEFTALCDCLASSLKLDKFRIYLTLEKDDILKLLSNEAVAMVLRGTRQLQVEKEFLVLLCILDAGDSNESASDEERDQYIHGLEKKYQKNFADLMTPNTLREQPSSNQMEEYLRLRSRALSPCHPSSLAPSTA
ncbi:hypothetical protein EG329_002816 [Mollisiaceae sp. DMI_Dod_QoI]|nr:hypothetical protein EG329_002816 [Helotiales sp. DMI_Dod_QoI]